MVTVTRPSAFEARDTLHERAAVITAPNEIACSAFSMMFRITCVEQLSNPHRSMGDSRRNVKLHGDVFSDSQLGLGEL